MAVTNLRRKQVQFVPSELRRQQNNKQNQANGSLVPPILKASLSGGLGLLILMLLGFVSPPAYAPIVSLILVVPGFFVVCLTTGLLAGVLAGDVIKHCQQGGEIGWTAGFWTGIIGSIGAMFMAAIGVFMTNFGQGVVSQFRPEQLEAWGAYIAPGTIALATRVFGALVVYGLIGSLVCALLISIGGMIYAKFHTNASGRRLPTDQGCKLLPIRGNPMDCSDSHRSRKEESIPNHGGAYRVSRRGRS